MNLIIYRVCPRTTHVGESDSGGAGANRIRLRTELYGISRRQRHRLAAFWAQARHFPPTWADMVEFVCPQNVSVKSQRHFGLIESASVFTNVIFKCVQGMLGLTARVFHDAAQVPMFGAVYR